MDKLVSVRLLGCLLLLFCILLGGTNQLRVAAVSSCPLGGFTFVYDPCNESGCAGSCVAQCIGDPGPNEQCVFHGSHCLSYPGTGLPDDCYCDCIQESTWP